MAFAHVQEVHQRVVTASTLTTTTYTVPAGGVAAGNLLVLAQATSLTAASVTAAVTDTQGNTWTTHLNLDHASTGMYLHVASCRVATPLVSGNTIVVTLTGTGGAAHDRGGVVHEFSGPDTSPFDAIGSAQGSSTTPSASVTVAQADELLIGAGAAFARVWDPGSGFTELNEIAFDTRDLLFEWRTIGAGSQAANYSTAGASTSWLMAAVAFKTPIATYTEAPAFVGELCDAGMSEVYTAPPSGPPAGSLMLLGVGR